MEYPQFRLAREDQVEFLLSSNLRLTAVHRILQSVFSEHCPQRVRRFLFGVLRIVWAHKPVPTGDTIVADEFHGNYQVGTHELRECLKVILAFVLSKELLGLLLPKPKHLQVAEGEPTVLNR